MDNLVGLGVELAIFGMGTVFVFLVVLIFITMAMSTLVLRYLPEVVQEPVAAGARSDSLSSRGQLIAVISAAITKHRNNRK